MESVTDIPTPSIPLQAPQLLVDYAKRLPRLPQPLGDTTVFVPADTTGFSGVSNEVRVAYDAVVFVGGDTGGHALTGTASVVDVRPRNSHFPYREEIVTPITRRMTSLLAEVAVHRAVTAMVGEWVTKSIPGIVLNSSRYFAETSGLGVGTIEKGLQSHSPEEGLLSEEVSAFASAHALRSYLAQAIALVRKSFTTQQGLDVKYEHDYEAQQDWLCINVKVEGEVDTILQQYDNYVRQFNRTVPWPDRSFIRLNYDII